VVSSRYRERYDRFRRRFCSLEDGHATERMLELVLPERVTSAA
jgi:CDP-glycerol glycerophosphotransferase (TagB/SpsB family)